MISVLKTYGRCGKLVSCWRHSSIRRFIPGKIIGDMELRQLQRSELPQILTYANMEGRNHSLAYLQACYDLFPQGWWGIVRDGKVLGSTVIHHFEDNKTAMSGFLLVGRDYRDLGIGKILNEFNTSLGEGKNAFVLSVNPDYMYKQSFKLSNKVVTYELRKVQMDVKMTSSVQIVPLVEELLPKLQIYDSKIHPIPRTLFFNKIILGCAHSVFLALDTSDNVIGYGTLRRANEGWRIAPLYAETDDVGWQLMMTLLNEIQEGQLVSTASFADNLPALALQEEFGFKVVSSSSYMYTKSPPAVPIDKGFSLATKEFTLC